MAHFIASGAGGGGGGGGGGQGKRGRNARMRKAVGKGSMITVNLRARGLGGTRDEIRQALGVSRGLMGGMARASVTGVRGNGQIAVRVGQGRRARTFTVPRSAVMAVQSGPGTE